MVALLWLMAPTLASASSVNSPLDGEPPLGGGPPLTGEPPPQSSDVLPEAASDDIRLKAVAHNLAGRPWLEDSQHSRALV